MDITIDKQQQQSLSTPSDLPLDHVQALAGGRAETIDHPAGKPDLSVRPLRSRHDLIRARPAIELELQNEYGGPELVKIVYGVPGVTQPDQLVQNFEVDRVIDIATSPNEPHRLALLKRLFAKRAAMADLREHARLRPLPAGMAQHCRAEANRAVEIVKLLGRLKARVTAEA